jgi:hypothetical protein
MQQNESNKIKKSSVKARQGLLGYPVLVVLLVSMSLTILILYFLF